jgi:hypothetical protein
MEPFTKVCGRKVEHMAQASLLMLMETNTLDNGRATMLKVGEFTIRLEICRCSKALMR